MSLQQYNQLMSSILNQKKVLAKLRAELEGREERKCWECKRFGHLTHNYRNQGRKKKGKTIPQNKFEILASRVMQCGVKEKVKVRWQETEEGVRCFRCWEMGYFKWECPRIEVERRRKEKKAVHVTRPQKAQQDKRPVHFLWEKAQEYSGT